MKLTLSLIKKKSILINEFLRFANTKDFINLEIPDNSIIETNDKDVFDFFNSLMEFEIGLKIKTLKYIYNDYFEIINYNENGKIIYHNNSLNHYYKIEYDSNGNIIKYEDFENYISEYVYDNNKLIKEIHKENDKIEFIEYYYDNEGNLININTNINEKPFNISNLKIYS